MNAIDIKHIQRNVDFPELMGKRILITGGTGFVGRWLDCIPDFHPMAVGRQLFEHSLEYDWDIIIHAAPVDVDPVIESARRSVAMILHISSGAAQFERTQYGQDKKRNEDKLLASGLRVKIARLWSFSGYGLPEHLVLPTFIRAAMRNEPLMVTREKVTRSYMYAADMAIWIWSILLYGKLGEIYNVGSVYPVTLQRLAKEVLKHFQYGSMQEVDRYCDPQPYYIPDVSKTVGDCGVIPLVDFASGISRTVRDYKNE